MFVDNNHLQLDGVTDEIMPNLDLAQKFSAFGFEAYEIDGNDIEKILETFDAIRANVQNGKPKCIIGNTIKGKGVSFMENAPGWHGVAPNKEQYDKAITELEEGF